MKRKGSSGEPVDTNGTKRRKREKKSDSDQELIKPGQKGRKELENLVTKLDISSPEAVVTSVLAPHTVESFHVEHWEKKPLYIKRGDKEFYGNFLSKDIMLEILEKNRLDYEVDVNAWKWFDGEKDCLNGDDVVKGAEVKRLLENSRATVQFHQPQRFSASLWKVMELLEKYFGSIVGANVLITPKESQGLKPQSSDMEDFVLQLEGVQKWTLYKPLQELSREFNRSLSHEEIGEKILEVNLEPGDCLYYPRGTIFESCSLSEEHSTHLTLSTFHNNAWGDFIMEGIMTGLEAAISNEVELRKGLPLDYFRKLGTGKFLADYMEGEEEVANGRDADDKGNRKPKVERSPRNVPDELVKQFKNKVKDLLCRVVDHFDPNTVTDSRCEGFMANRLPPFEKLADDEIGREPTMESCIKILYPDHLRLVVYDDDDDDEFDAEAADETDEEDIVGGDDEMEEDEDDDREEEEEERQAKKGNSYDKQKYGKGKQKERGIEKKMAKKGKSEDGDMEEDIDEEDEEDAMQGPHIRLLFSVHNPREAHMIGGLQEPNAVKLALHFAKSVKHLLDNCNQFTSVKDLPLDEENEKLELVKTLWTEKLICIE